MERRAKKSLDPTGLLPSFYRTLVVTIHEAKHLPAMDSDGTSDPYCVLRYGRSKAETSCVRSSLDPTWEESFEFDMDMPASPEEGAAEAVIIDIFDRDWFIGIPLKPDYIGQAKCSLEKIGDRGASRWLAIRNLAKGADYKESQIRVSVHVRRVARLEEQTFWGMLEKPTDQAANVNGSAVARKDPSLVPGLIQHLHPSKQATSPSDHHLKASESLHVQTQAEQQEIEFLRKLFPHMRPVITNILKVLYLGVRPIMLLLLWHRRLILDWEKPGSTVLFYILFLMSWWYEVMLGSFFVYMTFFTVYMVLSRQAPVVVQSAGPPRPPPAEMVEAYKIVKSKLLYRDFSGTDPLLKDVDVLARWTLHLADWLQLYHDNLVFYADRRIVGYTLGALTAIAIVTTFLHRIVDDIVYYALRYGILYAFVRFAIVGPTARRYPELFPTVFGWILPPVRAILRLFGNWWRKSTRLRRLTKAEEWEEATNSGKNNVSMTAADWDYLCEHVGHRMPVRKGQVLEEPGSARDVLYRLKKGRLEMRSTQNMVQSPSTLIHAPATLLTANILYGSGILLNSLVARTNAVVFVINVVELRQFLANEPNIAERFFMDLAMEIAVELKYFQEKIYHKLKVQAIGTRSKQRADEKEKEEADAADAVVVASATVVEHDQSSEALASTPPAVDLAPVPLPKLSLAPSPTSLRRKFDGKEGDHLRRTQNMFSMTAQDVLPSEVASFEKMAVFFVETFHIPVVNDDLRVFTDGIWTKRGWTRFPGRVFVTPTHLAFWSQVRRAQLGIASKGASVESWILPLAALLSVSLHEREGHVVFTFNRALAMKEPQHEHCSEVLHSSKGKALKQLIIKVYCDNASVLAEVRRAVEANSTRRDAGVRLATPLNSDIGKGSQKASIALVEQIAVPVVGGVELTAGSLNAEAFLSGAFGSDEGLFHLEVISKKIIQGVGRGVKKVIDQAVAAALPGKDDVTLAPEGIEAILKARGNVLSLTDKQHVAGRTADERERNVLIFSEGDDVIQANMHYERGLLQIISGQCSLLMSDGTLLADVTAGQLLGVTAHVFNERTRFTLRCKTQTEIRQLTHKNLQAAFRLYPGLGGRFNEFLCYNMTNSLNIIVSAELALSHKPADNPRFVLANNSKFALI